MGNLNFNTIYSDRNDKFRIFCPNRSESNFRLVSSIRFLCISVFLLIGCASLLPPEKRVYPKNPVTLPKGMDIHQWIETKKNQYPDRLRSYSPYPDSYKILFYRKKFTNLGSFISCGAFLRQTNIYTIEIIEMVSNVNYANYEKSVIPRGGELGPMNEKERTEILLPCIDEFLEPPQTKE
ncbi:hypothetical protein EHQ23_13140 [Leptospira bourretii]|uniref:Uncharacterized protein n=1 Tax=Leptospira bourretii TaxID=2484962 RepID=A0A4R9IR22_9LEPT|nr:hypothetical protein EHQ23_13140 [Leptospira bourretii]TGK94477.1 hypothetical protein EHQ26_00570 [Leptospira bourretii]TGL33206.1 hypothetical protein EHQ45_11080 [Leptospira bourretii]